MLQYDFEQSVGYWVVMTAHAFQKALNEELAPHGITYRQWQVLAWLAHDLCLSQNELAERMEIEPATLVSVLARMERDGWIAREDCPDDRRKRMVRATPQAVPAWERGAACARRVRSRATRDLPADQLAIVERCLTAMRHNLSLPPLEEEPLSCTAASATP